MSSRTEKDPPDKPKAAEAQCRTTTPFDFIIVGSGAGGGPLAARLALGGKKVLVLEAGGDPAEAGASPRLPDSKKGEVYHTPGYYAAASEDPEMSWMFSVRHFKDDDLQKQDHKYEQHCNPNVPLPGPSKEQADDTSGGPDDPRALLEKFKDNHPNRGVGTGKQGIFYPRAAVIGGCTSHHAMILIAPNDKDWNGIADLTGDDSWRAGQMRGYFAKMEKCLYLDAYQKAFRRFLGGLYAVWRRIAFVINPRAVLDKGGHGDAGWQPTGFIDPDLVSDLAKEDRGFFNVLARSVIGVLEGNRPLVAMFKKALFQTRVTQFLDPNDLNTRAARPEGVFLIPAGIGEARGRPGGGARLGVREFLLETRAELDSDKSKAGKLVIETGVHAIELIFNDSEEDKKKDPQQLQAIGVRAVYGWNLYEASPVQKQPERDKDGKLITVDFFTKGEVILCGGAFNTPQLLMLSGIGDDKQLEQLGIPVRVKLPGVGKNLQDRYEVTVVSQVDKEFSSLKGLSYLPGDKEDGGARRYRKDSSGLYATNGGALAVMRRSAALADHELEPDTFTFGVPAAFRGYYWNWSREVFCKNIGGTETQRDLWTWVILKAYTGNDKGTVTLRSRDPFASPEIQFNSFPGTEPDAEKCTDYDPVAAQAAAQAARKDLKALVDSVKFFRSINAKNPQFIDEIQPSEKIRDDSAELEHWVKTQAWGHHACGTCRIGADRWRRNAAELEKLEDKDAVLDSKFRVHGVRGLRVVDASVFPKIPGYFITVPIFMISEKAADQLLTESPTEDIYPAELRHAERTAIDTRRKKAGVPATGWSTTTEGRDLLKSKKKVQDDEATGEAGDAEPRKGEGQTPPAENPELPEGPARGLPPETIGLALSGGGVRSATFSLGALQALASVDLLRWVDVLSTVSGGGFTGSFLGRLFTRPMVTRAPDPAGRVRKILTEPSASVSWLRTQANYIAGAGVDDLKTNVGLYLRNVLAVYLVIGSLTFALFGVLRIIADKLTKLCPWLAGHYLPAPPDPATGKWLGFEISPWWILLALVLTCGFLPSMHAYWLAPKAGSTRVHPPYPLLAWLILLGGAVAVAVLPGGLPYAAVLATILLLAWGWQELARRDLPKDPRRHGVIVRNRLSRTCGEMLFLTLLAAGWVLLDTLARSAARDSDFVNRLMVVSGSLVPLLPVLKKLAEVAVGSLSKNKKEGGTAGSKIPLMAAGLVAVPLLLLLLFAADVAAHRIIEMRQGWGVCLIALASVFSLCMGRAMDFLNLSTLQTSYSARVTRTYQGATNEERIFGSDAGAAGDVQFSHPADDIPFHHYHPEAMGGPLHLVNVCINETVDIASQRELADRKGIGMCVGPHGVSVGRRFHGIWARPDKLSRWQRFVRWLEGQEGGRDEKTALRPLLPPNGPGSFHVLASRKSTTAPVERLTLGNWIGISGAAFSTGIGRKTTKGLALLMGLVNLRLGYWWDSGIPGGDRPGRYPQPLWRRIKSWPATAFRMQSLLLSEWRAYFTGPSRRLWPLSDGGHFENIGVYEFIRRRVPFIIATDATADPDYDWDDLSKLMRQVRQDFNAEIEWIQNPKEGAPGGPPPWISRWLTWKGLGSPQDVKDGSKPVHALLGKVTYGHAGSPYAHIDPLRRGKSDGEQERLMKQSLEPGEDPEVSWIILIKASLSPTVSQDICNYAQLNPSFPHQSTSDQIFDDEQWESYRNLGLGIGRMIFKDQGAPPSGGPQTSATPPQEIPCPDPSLNTP